MKKLLQALTVALVVVLGAGNAAMYALAGRAQRVNGAQMTMMRADWEQVQLNDRQTQQIADRMGAFAERLSRVEGDQDAARAELNATRGEMTSIRNEMSVIRTDYDRMRRIMYLEEKARISEQAAERIHDIAATYDVNKN